MLQTKRITQTAALLLIVVMLFTLFPISAFADGVFSMSLSSASASPGDTVTLILSGTNSPNDLWELDVYFEFDHNVLSIDKSQSVVFKTNSVNYYEWLGAGEEIGICIAKDEGESSFSAEGELIALDIQIASNAPDGNYTFALVGTDNNPNGTNYNSAIITVGSGSSTPTTIPAGDIEKPTGVDMTVEGSYDGSNATINVACDTACVVVGVKDGVYSRLTYDGTSGHTFTTNDYEDGMTFIVAVKGDVDGSGSITPTDWGSLIEAYNGSSLSDLGAIVGDVDGSGSITPTDWGSLIEAYNGSSLAWN